MLAELASSATIPPDVAVDGVVADPEEALETQTAGDLLRAPIQDQATLNEAPLFGGEEGVAATLGPTISSALIV